MKKTILILLILIAVIISPIKAAWLLIPMDDIQQNHLKAYGIAYWVLSKDVEVEWLLNYRGGSYLMEYHPEFEKECTVRGVTSQVITNVQASAIRQHILQPDVNMDIVKLQKAPHIAVYSPKNKQPWDDAVTMALTYAEIPYDVVYDKEVLSGMLPNLRLASPASRRFYRTVW